jgi:hydrogenase-4 component B
MTSVVLILVAACLLAGSGVPGLFGSRRSAWGERVAVVATMLAGVCGLVGILLPAAGPAPTLDAPWGLPWGRFQVALDPVSRAFLLPVVLIPALGTIYGLGYWRQREHPGNGRKLRLFCGLMPAAMVVILLAHDSALFLLAWEVMALSAFFLVSTEDNLPKSREAGWVYFIATHVGTLSLFAMFAVLRHATGSMSLSPIAEGTMSPALSNAVFLLAIAGFGLKAGLMPLHVWLPGAHANAPSHVSAVLSGVMLKMGIYGLVRMGGILPSPPEWWGATLLVAGAVSALGGIAFAIGQKDLKRLLAYSSIENIGIITIGVGLALLGRSRGQPAWVTLGLAGAVLHAWNHCLFKPLLFFGAGSILHGAGTRDIDRLGGLAHRMPQTAVLFLVGSVAICALPPLNGFAGELVVYLGLFRTLGADGGVSSPAAAAAVPALALVGAMAAAAFAKLFGVAFLGQSRTDQAGHAHESPPSMLAPMSVLAVLCVLLGVYPGLTATLVDNVVKAWWRGVDASPILAVTPLRLLPLAGATLLGMSGVVYLVLRRAMSPGTAARPGTWDCGYAAPSSRMQYTGSSFGQILVSLLSWALWPRIRRKRVRGLFPTNGRFRSEVPDTVLDRAVVPGLRSAAGFLRWMRLLQQGQIQVYVLYIVLIVVVLFISAYAV